LHSNSLVVSAYWRKEIIMAEIASAASVAVVLVHGGFVDGSGWEDVYKILKKDGYNVSIVQNPTLSLADDVAVTKRVLGRQKAPVILVGHSYGGVVITEAGNDPRVAGLVYIAAFAPDKGETWPKKRPSSWPTRRSPGVWRPSAAQSENQRGRPSRVGTWSQPTTR
jgi:pimeloyl-ACP methyl ester carboxylesterase